MTVRVEVWSDFACPWCYIGKRRLDRTLAQLGDQAKNAVRWRSFEIGPERPSAPNRTVFEILTQDFHAEPETLLTRFNDIKRLGAELGLALDMTEVRPVNTRALHRLSHRAIAAGLADSFFERAFHAYHVEKLNVADADVLIGLGVSAGLDEADVSQVVGSDAYDSDVRSDQSRAVSLGITSVPTLGIEGGSILSLNSPALVKALGGAAP